MKVVPTGASFIQRISDRNKTNIMHILAKEKM